MLLDLSDKLNIKDGVLLGLKPGVDKHRLFSVTIPDSVTAIDSYAFCHSGLTEVRIPDSMTVIGVAAFDHCTNLTSIIIPRHVTAIHAGAFCGCTGLISVTIPDSVTEICYYAFLDCSGLTSVTIPASLTAIGAHAFYNCIGLSKVIFQGQVDNIHRTVFINCSPSLRFNRGELRVMLGLGDGKTPTSLFLDCFPCLVETEYQDYYIPNLISLLGGDSDVQCVDHRVLFDVDQLNDIIKYAKPILMLLDMNELNKNNIAPTTLNDLLENKLWSYECKRLELSNVNIVVVGKNKQLTPDIRERLFHCISTHFLCSINYNIETDNLGLGNAKLEPESLAMFDSGDYPTVSYPQDILEADYQTIEYVLQYGYREDIPIYVSRNRTDELQLLPDQVQQNASIFFVEYGGLVDSLDWTLDEVNCKNHVMLYESNPNLVTQLLSLSVIDLENTVFCVPDRQSPIYSMFKYIKSTKSWSITKSGQDYPIAGIKVYPSSINVADVLTSVKTQPYSFDAIQLREEVEYNYKLFTATRVAQDIINAAVGFLQSEMMFLGISGDSGIGKDALVLALLHEIQAMNDQIKIEHMTAGSDISVIDFCQQLRHAHPSKLIILLASELNMISEDAMRDLSLFLAADGGFRVIGTLNQGETFKSRFVMNYIKQFVESIEGGFYEDELKGFANWFWGRIDHNNEFDLNTAELIACHKTRAEYSQPGLRTLCRAINQLKQFAQHTLAPDEIVNPYTMYGDVIVSAFKRLLYFSSLKCKKRTDSDFQAITSGSFLSDPRGRTLGSYPIPVWKSVAGNLNPSFASKLGECLDYKSCDVMAIKRYIDDPDNWSVIEAVGRCPQSDLVVFPTKTLSAIYYCSYDDEETVVTLIAQSKQGLLPCYTEVMGEGEIVDAEIVPSDELDSDVKGFFTVFFGHKTGRVESDVQLSDLRKVVLQHIGLKGCHHLTKRELVKQIVAWFNGYYDGEFLEKPAINGLDGLIRRRLWSFLNRRGICSDQAYLIHTICQLFGVASEVHVNSTHEFVVLEDKVILDVSYFKFQEKQAYKKYIEVKRQCEYLAEHGIALDSYMGAVALKYLGDYRHDPHTNEGLLERFQHALNEAYVHQVFSKNFVQRLLIKAKLVVTKGKGKASSADQSAVKPKVVVSGCSYAALLGFGTVGEGEMLWRVSEDIVKAIEHDQLRDFQDWLDLCDAVNDAVRSAVIEALVIIIQRQMPKADCVMRRLVLDKDPVMARPAEIFRGKDNKKYRLLSVNSTSNSVAGKLHLADCNLLEKDAGPNDVMLVAAGLKPVSEITGADKTLVFLGKNLSALLACLKKHGIKDVAIGEPAALDRDKITVTVKAIGFISSLGDISPVIAAMAALNFVENNCQNTPSVITEVPAIAVL